MLKDSSNLSLSAKVFLILVGTFTIAFKTLPNGDYFGLFLILLGISFLFLPFKENRYTWLIGWFFLAVSLLCLAAFISAQFPR
jgi:hypothetical protein